VNTTASIVALAVVLLGIIGLWRTFAKANHPGWGAIIPIFNLFLFIKTAGRPGWWILLYLIPVINLFVHAVVCMDVARNFGKTKTFGIIALWLLSVIGFVILGFGDAEYSVEAHEAGDRQVTRATNIAR
jgi:hypothetical protein